jgi:hypothetical protein
LIAWGSLLDIFTSSRLGSFGCTTRCVTWWTPRSSSTSWGFTVDIGYNVLRGIEVKVSKSDFKNGFICTSANYNYVLVPTKLVSPSIMPKGVGLIEFNRYKFNVEENDDENPNGKPFKLEGVRVIKRAQYRHIPQFHIDHVISMIAQRNLASKEDVLREVLLGMDNRELVYA